MAYGVPDQAEVTTALREFLEIYSEHPVGDHAAPTSRPDVLIPSEAPYSVLYAIPGGKTTGPPLGYTDSIAYFEYQITTVGLRRDQTQMLMQKIREVMIGRDLDFSLKYKLIVPGLVIMDRELASVPSGVTIAGKLFNAMETYFIKVGIEQ